MRPNYPLTIRVLALVATAGVVSGCAMKGDIRDLQTEIQALAARTDSLVTQLRLDSQSTQDTLRTQSDQLFDFRGDISQQLRAIAQSLRTLEALAGENQRGIASVRDQLANQRRTSGTTSMVTTPDTAGAPPRGGESLVGGGGNAEQLWSAAREQYNRGSLSTASRAFEQFLSQYPTHDQAPDAHYFLADILTEQNRPDDALVAFQKVPQLFPTAPRVPDALYRIALLQLQAGRTTDAKSTLERIVNTYPDATIAMLARDKLREIG